jgi:phage baseplate assembly protein W
MGNGVTYGINFPFGDSLTGKYLNLSETPSDEIKNNLIHLLLTRKGSRYFLPDFGTRLYEYIFEPLDGPTFNDIETEIKDSVETYIPNLLVTSISVTALSSEEAGPYVTTEGNVVNTQLTISGLATKEYTAKVRIDYQITNDVFNSSSFVIINI